VMHHHYFITRKDRLLTLTTREDFGKSTSSYYALAVQGDSQSQPRTLKGKFMSNTELTQSLYQSFFRGDMPSVLSIMHDDVDWIWYGPNEIPWAGHHQGREAVGAFFGKVNAYADILTYEPLEFIAGEHGVVTVLGWQRVKAKPTGNIWESAWTHIFTIREDKIVRVREFYDSAVIAAAFLGHDE
jgi:uncharacterized protein